MSGSWRFLFRVLFRQRKKLVFPVRNGILFGFIFLAGVVVSKKSLMYRQKFFEREGLTETEVSWPLDHNHVIRRSKKGWCSMAMERLSHSQVNLHKYIILVGYWMVPNLTQRDLIR
eukprot:TRINITY_DN3005_c0_g1_i7.p1 TRINITY_DN3005_c0_g1~~TRINITY_DN3005_c0_g1_i7.p1  ORF type:complete len:132 (-),score=17.69 TRINITY_DN3005_c0_g1_i7:354-701(-)